ncbi:ankyrin repeat domain-containing protein [Aquimarina rubra]|uniref:Ankyrin repeat domain-containing protein n=1 Tax=Aquimarina rubra TaxID=1920033 RepID=A0ABW5LA37_9FLAO
MKYNNEITNELFELVDKRKYTPDDISKIKILLEQGANINYQESDYPFETILYRVISSWKEDQKLDILELLVSYGVDVNVKCDIFYPIEQAALKGDENLVKYLVENGANEGLQSALKTAIERDNLNIVEFLINTGIDVNLNEEYNTPFLNFCTESYRTRDRKKEYHTLPGLISAQLLIDQGADPNGIVGLSPTPLQNAVNEDFSEFVDLLFDKGIEQISEDDPVLIMVQSLELAEVLIDKGANINAHSEEYRLSTPLISSVKKGNKDLIRFFIDSGADLYLADVDNFTAFHHAVLSEEMELIKYLVNFYDIKKCDKINSLLSLADTSTIKEMINELLADGE